MRTPELEPVTRRTDQKVVLSTTIFTLPGSFAFFVNVGSMSIGSSKSSVLSTDTESSVSPPSEDGGGEPAERNIPAAAAWVSVGELSVADGPLRPLELRAMRMWDGFTDMGKRQ
jgi:hypothetical protein